MKRIVFIFCLISTASFASTPENPLVENSPVQLERVESSISESWSVTFSQEVEAKVISQNSVVTLAGPGNSVFCLFSDGEYWIGSTNNENVLTEIVSNCSESGGQPFLGSMMQ